MTELKVFETQIEAREGVINFSGYEELKEQALQVAEHINTMEVTEENVKETKKILATVNKAIKNLNDERIAIKKKMLEPYNIFESQIKEIESIVKTADERVRAGVRELEEKERSLKKDEIYSIWMLRVDQYEFAKLMTFGDFLNPQHLNKSTTMKKVEEDMVNFLESAERDIKLLSGMDNSEDLIRSYRDVKDVTIVLELENKRIEDMKSIKEQLKDVDIESFVFKVFNKKDKKLVEILLEENDIDYKEII